MGGRYGDGPVDTEEGAPFAAAWQRRALGLTLAMGALGRWNIDASRRARESLRPADYMRFGYYEKWIAAVADLSVERGLLTRDDLAKGTAEPGAPDPAMLRPEDVADVLACGSPSARGVGRPAFAPGDVVRTRLPARNALVPGGHTRLPAYAEGRSGRVARCHGAHVLPDGNAHFLGEAPEPLYSVAFDAVALWGEAERPGDEVLLDLWESYLESAS